MNEKIEKIVEDYFSNPDIISYYSNRKLHHSEKKLFNRYLKKKGKVLDLFCGAGRVSIPIAKKGFYVIGVDNNLKMIKKAEDLKRKYNINNIKFICENVTKVKFKENTFDYVIIMENSLEHIHGKVKREMILKKINNWLDLNGILILSFHSYFYPIKTFLKIQLSNIENLIKGSLELNDCLMNDKNGKIYFHFFNSFEIENLLRKYKFQKLAVISYNEVYRNNNRFKNYKIYNSNLVKPLLYNFWIAKKIK